MYRLSIPKLLHAAAQKGDKTGYAISRRAQISESSAYRILAGESQPDLNTAMRLAEGYAVPVEALIERVHVESAAA